MILVSFVFVTAYSGLASLKSLVRLPIPKGGQKEVCLFYGRSLLKLALDQLVVVIVVAVVVVVVVVVVVSVVNMSNNATA